MFPFLQARFHMLSLKNMVMFSQHPPAYRLRTFVMMDATNAPQIHAPNVSTRQTVTSLYSMKESANKLVQQAHIKVMWGHVPFAIPPAPSAQQDLI